MASVVRTRRLALAAIVLIGAAMLLITFAFGGGSSPATADAAGKVVKVNIKDYEFSKKVLTVKKGTTIKWTNRDEMKHSVTSSKKGGPSSVRLGKDESYTFVAKTKGTFKYHCIPHPFMKATLVVN